MAFLPPTAFRFVKRPREIPGGLRVKGVFFILDQIWFRLSVFPLILVPKSWVHLHRSEYLLGCGLFLVVVIVASSPSVSFDVTRFMTELTLRYRWLGIELSRSTFPVAPGSRLLLVSPEVKPRANPLLIRGAALVRLESGGQSWDLGRMFWENTDELAEALQGAARNLEVVAVEGDALGQTRPMGTRDPSALDKRPRARRLWLFMLALTLCMAGGLYWMISTSPPPKHPEALPPVFLVAAAGLVAVPLLVSFIVPTRLRRSAYERFRFAAGMAFMAALNGVGFYVVTRERVLLAAAVAGVAALLAQFPSASRWATLERDAPP